MKTATFTRHDLKRLGTVLYGERWKSSMARALGCTHRYIQMLCTGDRPISPAFVADLQRLCDERLVLVDRWATRLKQHTAPTKVAHD